MEIIEITFKKPERVRKEPGPSQVTITDLGNGFKRIRIPLIRRIYPQLMAYRPMLSDGGVRVLRFRYSSNGSN